MKMLNKSDVRYLLIDEVWHEDYLADKDLVNQSDEIMKEVDKLRGDGSYAKWIRETGYDVDQDNKIMFLEGVLRLWDMKIGGKESALRVLKNRKYKYTTREQVQRAYNNRVFDKRVEAMKKEAETKDKKEITFEDICIPIERYFKGVEIPNDITVVKFIAWENRLKAEAKRAA